MRARSPGPSRPAQATGAYLLLVRVRSDLELDVGRLGRVPFRKGNYVYIGSGMGNLTGRVNRHFRRDKKVKWHIDRLLALAELMGAVLFPSAERQECELARSCLSFSGATAVRGFGSSDCRCPGHLVFLGARPFAALLGRLDQGYQGWKGGRVNGCKGTRAGTTRAFSPFHPSPLPPFHPSRAEVGGR